MKHTKHIGASFKVYFSASKAALSHALLPLGIPYCDNTYPIPFKDSEGSRFYSKPSFRCTHTGIFFEHSTGTINGLRTIANADRAMRAHCTDPYVTSENSTYKYTLASWDSSAPRHKAVQLGLSESGACSVLLFSQDPHPDTIGRLSRAGVFWCVYGSSTWRSLMSFRTLAKLGFRSEYTINGHTFKSHGGLVSAPL